MSDSDQMYNMQMTMKMSQKVGTFLFKGFKVGEGHDFSYTSIILVVVAICFVNELLVYI